MKRPKTTSRLYVNNYTNLQNNRLYLFFDSLLRLFGRCFVIVGVNTETKEYEKVTIKNAAKYK